MLVLEYLFFFSQIIVCVTIIDVLLILLLLVPKISSYVLVVPRDQPIFELSHEFLVFAFLKLLEVLVVFLVQWATHAGRCRPDNRCLRCTTPVSEDGTVLKLDALPCCPILVGEIHDGAISQQLVLLHAWLTPRVIQLILEILKWILRNGFGERVPFHAVCSNNSLS